MNHALKSITAIIGSLVLIGTMAACGQSAAEEQAAADKAREELLSQQDDDSDTAGNSGTDDEEKSSELVITYDCRKYATSGEEITGNDGFQVHETFTDYKETWSLINENLYSCEATIESGDIPQEAKDAAVTAYGEYDPTNKYAIPVLYGNCATTKADGILVNTGQVEETKGMLQFCPDHPDARQLEAKIQTIEKDNNFLKQKQDAGEVLPDGTYKIGSEMKPGTWKTSSEKVENCYWDLTDASGNIIINNFIPGAPSVIVNVPSTAVGFTSTGCGTWIKQ
jgi:hypothetical protein